MLYQVTNDLSEIQITPLSEVEEIIQNVRTIITTFQNSCPLYREFGIRSENLDMPLTVAKTKIAGELARQIAEFEVRCKLKTILVDANIDGTLRIIAQIDIG